MGDTCGEERGRADRGLKRKDAFTIDGVTKSMGEWCEKYDIGWSTVRDRLRRGYSVKKALTAPRFGEMWPMGLETINGVTKTRREWCREYGKTEKLVQCRTCSLGWRFIDALKIDKMTNDDGRFAIYGVRKSKEEWADYLGMDVNEIKTFAHNKNTGFPGAVKLILGNRLLLESMTATINGETHTLMEWAHINGTPERLVINRLAKEVPKEEAVMAVDAYTALLIRRANANRMARDRGQMTEPVKKTDTALIDFCLDCRKSVNKCCGDIMNCMREKLIREHFEKGG